MTESLSFGTVLARLMDRRCLDSSSLAEQAAIIESDLLAVLNGATPNEAQLRRIAPVLGLHAADLFAVAWLDLPADLAPRDRRAEYPLFHLAASASRLTPEQVGELRARANLLPLEERTKKYELPAPFGRFKHNSGGVLLRMFANRNLPIYAAYAIMGMTGRPLSPSSIFMAALDPEPPTPEALADYITLLDVDAADLTIMTGFELPDPLPQRPLEIAAMAEFIWDARRLAADQVQRLRDLGKTLSSDHNEAVT